MIDLSVKPFLKWAGGKRQLASLIANKYLPKHFNTYHEPFVGGGAILFTLQPTQAVINDINEELINCYKVIRDSTSKLIDNLKLHKNNEKYFYTIRDWDRSDSFSKGTPIERASRVIFLNKTCYNGLFRVNSKGQFNTPFGRYKNPNIVDENTLQAVGSYLDNNDIKILNTDFREALSSIKKDDFVYIDPPYDPVSDTASFTGYSISGFNRGDQIDLKQWFDKLNRKGCKLLLSNSNTKFINELYKDYKIEVVYASRAINSNAKKRGKIDEVLIRNY